MFWLHILSTLQRNIIPDDTCGRWLNLNFYSIFNSNFIQYKCHVLFYCINLSAVFVLNLLLCLYIVYITEYFNTLLGFFPPYKDLLNVHN